MLCDGQYSYYNLRGPWIKVDQALWKGDNLESSFSEEEKHTCSDIYNPDELARHFEQHLVKLGAAQYVRGLVLGAVLSASVSISLLTSSLRKSEDEPPTKPSKDDGCGESCLDILNVLQRLCTRENLDSQQLFEDCLDEDTDPTSEIATNSETIVASSNVDVHRDAFSLYYLYASPHGAKELSVHSELVMLSSLSSMFSSVNVRTASTHTLMQVWQASSQVSRNCRVFCLSTHCTTPGDCDSAAQRTILLEDELGRSHALKESDLIELLRLPQANVSRDLGKASRAGMDIVVLSSCHSESFAKLFVDAGASYAIGCDGKVSDVAARTFVQALLMVLAGEGKCVESAFLAAQSAVRLSPCSNVDFRAEADRFRLYIGHQVNLSLLPEVSCSLGGRFALSVPVTKLLPAVEDFVGRRNFFVEIAQLYARGRRVVWLHGEQGLGKTAICVEFCRFYGVPGDRLFSPDMKERIDVSFGASLPSGARIVDLADSNAASSLQALRRVLADEEEHASSGILRPRLLVLDHLEQMMALPALEVSACWQLLSGAMERLRHLRLMLVSRTPLYEILLPCKIVFCAVPPLSCSDAARLLARQAHRPLYARDFPASQSVSSGSKIGACAGLVGHEGPLALSDNFIAELAKHPIIQVSGGVPALLREAATKITPLLHSLLQHPALQKT